MSALANEPVSAPPARPSGRAFLAILVLAPLLSVALSALLVLSILHFVARVPARAAGDGTLADPSLLRDLVTPYVQEGTVPVKQFSGIVYYPIPYGSPPHLKLTSKSPDRSFAIVGQDERGFVWAIDVTLKDGKNLLGALKDVKDVSDLGGALKAVDGKLPALSAGEELTWEARGVRPFTTTAAIPPFVQEGTFTIPSGSWNAPPQEGTEHFPHPYATPPNVVPTHGDQVVLVATTPTGFLWKRPPGFGVAKVTWTAKGVRASPEQVAEFVKNPPLTKSELPPLYPQNGKFNYAIGEQGEVCFPRPYLSPPAVEARYVLITEITARGFKWRHPGVQKGTTTYETEWTAKGILTAMTPARTNKK